MGGKSTSHSAVLGDKRANAQDFDLRSWQGLTHVLKTAKDSLRDPAAYAEFRDLVLHYAQQGGDAEIRRKIDAVISTFPKGGGVTIPVISHEEKHKDQHETSATLKKEVVHERKEDAPTQHSEQRANTFTIPARRITPQFHKPAAAAEPTIVPLQPVTIIPEEISEQKPEVSKVPEFIPPSPAIPPAPKGDVKSIEAYKNRIIEIKRAINAHVGNPTALIDTPNDLGKKYMSALLSALKATGGGGTEGVDTAMQTLENAYAALMAYVPNNEPIQTNAVSAPEQAIEKESVEEPVPVVVPEPVVEESISEPEVEEITEMEKEPVFISPQRERQPVPPPYSTGPTAETEKYSASHTLATLLKAESSRASVEPPVSKPITPQSPSPVPQKVSEPAKEASGFQPNKYTNKGIGSYSPRLHESGINPSQVAVQQAELFSPEITDALNQLLSEWTLFNSSGLFGIGPSGPEHPLYLTLAPLSMGEVVAGRWEGSDMKTVKILKQYIDAWRHEQGIAYTINETFEHYLRRVVQKILKRQS